MTPEQKTFLMTTLPEAIVAEQGTTFGMEFWFHHGIPGLDVSIDGLTRKVPACGTICCIGGMADALMRPGQSEGPEEDVALAMGLTVDEGEALFYQWLPMEDAERDYDELGWPEPFALRFQAADTPLAKAQVAAELCVLVGETEGRCLHPVVA